LDATCRATSFSFMPLFFDLSIALNNRQKIPQRTEWVKTLSGLHLPYVQLSAGLIKDKKSEDNL
jgi:hypothetical protein